MADDVAVRATPGLRALAEDVGRVVGREVALARLTACLTATFRSTDETSSWTATQVVGDRRRAMASARGVKPDGPGAGSWPPPRRSARGSPAGWRRACRAAAVRRASAAAPITARSSGSTIPGAEEAFIGPSLAGSPVRAARRPMPAGS